MSPLNKATATAARRRGRHRERLPLPQGAPAALGYDAVGIPQDDAARVMRRLSPSRAGCVFSLGELWWWIVPAGSHIDIAWPESTTYSVDAYVPSGPRPRLVHRPDGDSPYTSPILLYIVTCQIAGTMPSWPHPAHP
ncbi:hypothetical protein [Streptomyces sp. NPDC050560]|uniref:hypothetical protein n=1 Tax=Streptomyces sp. NPDC050560 TaxID=3365630 RepID=UPI0037AAE5C7